ncbi:hypothetical protein [Mesotoga prima]|uniref:hypothetical protein n=1 Tax=Mesotoga prima TaxID=1184387 RepID=UPI002FDA3A28
MNEKDVEHDLVLEVCMGIYTYEMYISAEYKMINIITKIPKMDSNSLDTLLYTTIEDMRKRIWSTALVGFSEHIGNGIVAITRDKLVPISYNDASYNTYKLCAEWGMLSNKQVTTKVISIDYGRLIKYDSGLCTIIDALINGHGITFPIKDFIGEEWYG